MEKPRFSTHTLPHLKGAPDKKRVPPAILRTEECIPMRVASRPVYKSVLPSLKMATPADKDGSHKSAPPARSKLAPLRRQASTTRSREASQPNPRALTPLSLTPSSKPALKQTHQTESEESSRSASRSASLPRIARALARCSAARPMM